MDDYCQKIPKAELHIHIEGALEPELMLKLAKRNNIKLKYNTIEEIKNAYDFNSLQDFLDIYYEGASVLITENDFYELMESYLIKAIEDNVKRAEIFFDPQTHTSRNVSFETIVKGFKRAIDDMQTKYDISCILIMCFLRHLGGKEAVKTMKMSLAYLDYFNAVGLDSSEVGFEPKLFTEAYDIARSNNLKLVAHAGEEGPPCYIHQALNNLKVNRIDHGVRITEDKQLMQKVAKQRIPLTMCPLSNIKTRAINKLSDHPLKYLLDQGLCVTVNSDDPSYFGGYIAENYKQIAKALNLSQKDIYQLAKNSFEASFITEQQKQTYYQILESFNKQFNR